MANKTNNEKDIKKKTTSTAKKNTNNKSSVNKSTAKSTTKKNTNTSKKSGTSTKAKTNKTVKKTTNVNKSVKKDVIIKDTADNNITEIEKQEKEIIKEINNVNAAKLEEAKFEKPVKNKRLLPIGIILVILGLTAMIVSLIANRIVDREFMSDSMITLMIVISILIEAFGAFIIVSES